MKISQHSNHYGFQMVTESKEEGVRGVVPESYPGFYEGVNNICYVQRKLSVFSRKHHFPSFGGWVENSISFVIR